jgi:hypothetical protein
VQRSGFGPVKDRAPVHPRKDRSTINIQHFNLTYADSAPGGSSSPADYHQPVRFDRNFGSGFHDASLVLGLDTCPLTCAARGSRFFETRTI